METANCQQTIYASYECIQSVYIRDPIVGDHFNIQHLYQQKKMLYWELSSMSWDTNNT